LDDVPLGKIDDSGATWFKDDVHPRTPREDFQLDTKIDPRVGMLYSYPGMNPDILQPRERCASTSNRNFEGRQGKGGRTHLVSPQMAAAAAIAVKNLYAR
jgi:hypothetical protein